MIGSVIYDSHTPVFQHICVNSEEVIGNGEVIFFPQSNMYFSVLIVNNIEKYCCSKFIL